MCEHWCYQRGNRDAALCRWKAVLWVLSTGSLQWKAALRGWESEQALEAAKATMIPALGALPFNTLKFLMEVKLKKKMKNSKHEGHFVKLRIYESSRLPVLLIYNICVDCVVCTHPSQNTAKTSNFIEHVLWGLRFLHTNANIGAALCVSPMWACPKGLDNSLREFSHIKHWIEFIECPAWLCGHLLRDEAWTADNVSPYTCQTLTLDPQSATHGSCFIHCSCCVCNTTCCELTEEYWPQITTTWAD